MDLSEKYAGLTTGQIAKIAARGVCEPGTHWVEDDRVKGGGYCRSNRKKKGNESEEQDE